MRGLRPADPRPGEARVALGDAPVDVAGRFRKVAFFFIALPPSNAHSVRSFERECTETFPEGHARTSGPRQ